MEHGNSGLIRNASDVLLVMALITLPVDGTRLGVIMPYWTPIAPVFFTLYVLCNLRLFLRSMRQHLGFFLFLPLLVAVSFFGWLTVGFHRMYVFQTMFALVSGLACLASLDIAFRLKRLDWNRAVTIVVIVYWIAFMVGVLQWLDSRYGIEPVTFLSQHLMERNYVPRKPQFLFAEPSYIGMHIFGVLLPLFWLTRRKSLALLVLVFAFGSACMGVGVRILIDTVIALLLWAVIEIRWNRARNIIAAFVGIGAISIGGALMLLRNARVQSLLQHGLMQGDFSMLARIFRSLAPMLAGLHAPAHLVFGFGMGNIKNAMLQGYDDARNVIIARGGDPSGNVEIRLIANTDNSTYYFTMNAYVSFITEFGIIMLAAFLILLLAHVQPCLEQNHNLLADPPVLPLYPIRRLCVLRPMALHLGNRLPQTGRNPTPEICQLRTAIENRVDSDSGNNRTVRFASRNHANQRMLKQGADDFAKKQAYEKAHRRACGTGHRNPLPRARSFRCSGRTAVLQAGSDREK